MRSAFTVLVDSAEQHPWKFLKISAPNGFYHVPCERKQLGQYSNGNYEPRGDYAIKGHEGKCHIERKSGIDMMSTMLGFTNRRPRFERELEVLQNMEVSAVIIECSLGFLLSEVTKSPFGNMTQQEKMKSIYGTFVAWQMDFRVPFIFCDTRGLAEKTCYKIFTRYWRKHVIPNAK